MPSLPIYAYQARAFFETRFLFLGFAGAPDQEDIYAVCRTGWLGRNRDRPALVAPPVQIPARWALVRCLRQRRRRVDWVVAAAAVSVPPAMDAASRAADVPIPEPAAANTQ